METQRRTAPETQNASPGLANVALPPGTTQKTLAIVMGGGAGTRLFP